MKKTLEIIYILVTSVCVILSANLLYYKHIIIGDMQEREKLLQATVWQLDSEGITDNDVEQITIRYNYFKGGEMPYTSRVILKKDLNKELIYSCPSYSHYLFFIYGDFN